MRRLYNEGGEKVDDCSFWYTSIMPSDLEEIVKHIVDKSLELKNKYTDAKDASIEFACIFCQNEAEYNKFDELAKKYGEVAENTPTGDTYLLNDPIQTSAGPLRLLKIRKPDPNRRERGDTDFNTDYLKFKEKYEGKPNFELVKRETFEMLRLSDPDFDAMACFSNVPKSKDLGQT
jgi:(2Fe-2S) ferredoxin